MYMCFINYILRDVVEGYLSSIIVVLIWGVCVNMKWSGEGLNWWDI